MSILAMKTHCGRAMAVCGTCIALYKTKSFQIHRKTRKNGSCKYQLPLLRSSALKAAELPIPDLESVRASVNKDKAVTWEKLSATASVGVICSVTSLVEITASQLVDTEQLYQKYLEMLIEVLRAYTRYLGTGREDQLWSTAMFLRSSLAEIKSHRQQLHLLWGSCVTLSDSSSHAAFLTGADQTACRLGDLISSCTISVERLTRNTDSLLRELAKVEVEEIKASTKLHQKQNDTTNSQSPDMTAEQPKEADSMTTDPSRTSIEEG